jgi:hypothetical protein
MKEKVKILWKIWIEIINMILKMTNMIQGLLLYYLK